MQILIECRKKRQEMSIARLDTLSTDVFCIISTYLTLEECAQLPPVSKKIYSIFVKIISKQRLLEQPQIDRRLTYPDRNRAPCQPYILASLVTPFNQPLAIVPLLLKNFFENNKPSPLGAYTLKLYAQRSLLEKQPPPFLLSKTFQSLETPSPVLESLEKIHNLSTYSPDDESFQGYDDNEKLHIAFEAVSQIRKELTPLAKWNPIFLQNPLRLSSENLRDLQSCFKVLLLNCPKKTNILPTDLQNIKNYFSHFEKARSLIAAILEKNAALFKIRDERIAFFWKAVSVKNGTILDAIVNSTAFSTYNWADILQTTLNLKAFDIFEMLIAYPKVLQALSLEERSSVAEKLARDYHPFLNLNYTSFSPFLNHPEMLQPVPFGRLSCDVYTSFFLPYLLGQKPLPIAQWKTLFIHSTNFLNTDMLGNLLNALARANLPEHIQFVMEQQPSLASLGNASLLRPKIEAFLAKYPNLQRCIQQEPEKSTKLLHSMIQIPFKKLCGIREFFNELSDVIDYLNILEFTLKNPSIISQISSQLTSFDEDKWRLIVIHFGNTSLLLEKQILEAQNLSNLQTQFEQSILSTQSPIGSITSLDDKNSLISQTAQFLWTNRDFFLKCKSFNLTSRMSSTKFLLIFCKFIASQSPLLLQLSKNLKNPLPSQPRKVDTFFDLMMGASMMNIQNNYRYHIDGRLPTAGVEEIIDSASNSPQAFHVLACYPQFQLHIPLERLKQILPENLKPLAEAICSLKDLTKGSADEVAKKMGAVLSADTKFTPQAITAFNLCSFFRRIALSFRLSKFLTNEASYEAFYSQLPWPYRALGILGKFWPW